MKFIRRGIKKILGKFGIEVRKIPAIRLETSNYVLYQYLKKDGTFDYDAYKNIQIKGNKDKLEFVWVTEESIAFLSNYIKKRVGKPQFGICHGTRRGKEQEWFGKYLGCRVLGTEISDTANMFPNTIQWDFHDVKDEWLNAADFIYSNSFDHSYDPENCLNSWMKCIRVGGLCVLEHSSKHSKDGASYLDPFGADLVQMVYLITLWGKGAYGVREIILKPDGINRDFIVIQRYE